MMSKIITPKQIFHNIQLGHLDLDVGVVGAKYERVSWNIDLEHFQC